ncbi:ScbA/BarX family gamma-butyrolactone biosynthesis protein [Arthrobacter bambusae]|uniref:A-factor biosynthesis hotdog domain-containing protein n=1 Tax=Arthrobacter bambusae TaxID=1338426 RepID=A0AAW8DDM1_9MICC|nr:ScbA/BarX family gamma-butyrolactone biosynthesis protein [Arthrobacter bambusae]MDP9904603.1 hypothetical protein [Arthrobacter bambusae]MDQ0129419.1 hypothetical protein [Arthrobacter bambusae]MDQ0180968.1 hypothetical protein [Arthrobacter bambusae]
MVGATPEDNERVSSDFSSPVDRKLVHRRSVSEVFLTGIEPAGDNSYKLSAQWPRWHVFYGSLSRGFDSALVVETLRQLTVLIAHTQLDVPLGMRFLMSEMFVSMAPNAVRDTSRPAEVTIQVRVSDVRQSRSAVTYFQTTATFLVDGIRIAGGRAGARIVDPVVYDRFRSGRETTVETSRVAPVSPAMVGHGSAWNVVLGRNTGKSRWPLRVDVSNPVLFDHPLDHVPGVVLIEAVRQALRLQLMNPALDFAFFDAQFMSVVELGAGTEVVLETAPTDPGPEIVVASIQSYGEIMMRVIARPGSGA